MTLTAPTVFTTVLLLVLLAVQHSACGSEFVVRSHGTLSLGGRPYRFSGANNPYLGSAPNLEVEEVLTTAVSHGLRVLRAWGFADVGDPGGSDAVDGERRDVFYQFWNGREPVINEGPNGFQKLDYLIFRSGRMRLKLIVALTNNWPEFGGMDQYVRWRGASYHDDFYRDPVIKGWYKAYATQVLNRVNVYTGVAYKDDPAILAWELANEPRCQGRGLFPGSAACDVALLTAWTAEMSAHLKRVDSKHLVAVGDEGFYCSPGGVGLTEDCTTGIDALALGALPAVDYVSLHLYPEDWGKSAAWGAQWIDRHVTDAKRLGKPLVLGEFGMRDRTARPSAYQAWTDVLWKSGAAGDVVWMLASRRRTAAQARRDDGYVLRCGDDPVCALLQQHAHRMTGRGPYRRVTRHRSISAELLKRSTG